MAGYKTEEKFSLYYYAENPVGLSELSEKDQSLILKYRKDADNFIQQAEDYRGKPFSPKEKALVLDYIHENYRDILHYLHDPFREGMESFGISEPDSTNDMRRYRTFNQLENYLLNKLPNEYIIRKKFKTNELASKLQAYATFLELPGVMSDVIGDVKAKKKKDLKSPVKKITIPAKEDSKYSKNEVELLSLIQQGMAKKFSLEKLGLADCFYDSLSSKILNQQDREAFIRKAEFFRKKEFSKEEMKYVKKYISKNAKLVLIYSKYRPKDYNCEIKQFRNFIMFIKLEDYLCESLGSQFNLSPEMLGWMALLLREEAKILKEDGENTGSKVPKTI